MGSSGTSSSPCSWHSRTTTCKVRRDDKLCALRRLHRAEIHRFPPARFEALFHVLDFDKNGTVDQGEIRRGILRLLGAFSSTEVRLTFVLLCRCPQSGMLCRRATVWSCCFGAVLNWGVFPLHWLRQFEALMDQLLADAPQEVSMLEFSAVAQDLLGFAKFVVKVGTGVPLIGGVFVS